MFYRGRGWLLCAAPPLSHSHGPQHGLPNRHHIAGRNSPTVLSALTWRPWRSGQQSSSEVVQCRQVISCMSCAQSGRGEWVRGLKRAFGVAVSRRSNSRRQRPRRFSAGGGQRAARHATATVWAEANTSGGVHEEDGAERSRGRVRLHTPCRSQTRRRTGCSRKRSSCRWTWSRSRSWSTSSRRCCTSCTSCPAA